MFFKLSSSSSSLKDCKVPYNSLTAKQDKKQKSYTLQLSFFFLIVVYLKYNFDNTDIFFFKLQNFKNRFFNIFSAFKSRLLQAFVPTACIAFLVNCLIVFLKSSKSLENISLICFQGARGCKAQESVLNCNVIGKKAFLVVYSCQA